MSRNTMKAVAYKSKGSELELVEIAIPSPPPGWVRIKVLSCGICHSDIQIKDLINELRVPGHEVIGKIDKLGEGIKGFTVGEMVGVGFFGGGHCGVCNECLDGEWLDCKCHLPNGLAYNGGYAEYQICPQDALVKVPNGMSPIESAPLLCAGVTVYNGIRNLNLKSGALIGIQGIGGLGHLAVQFARKMGYEVIAMSYGSKKEHLSKELGANHYVDMSKESHYEEIKKIGSVKCIVCTAPSSKEVPKLLNCLGSKGKLLLAAAFEDEFKVAPLSLIFGSKSIISTASGDSRDSQDTLHFANLNNVKPIVQPIPLEKAPEALKNISNARFRYVISFLDENNRKE
ncbi:hypothetical protein DICPUDRAFT_47417 [Dictyostelium purpureum]|uniref:Enoyl reductase (ER) domain-containing protein n=1 Tax=Dictyostelium purpureum TaxID=5786 RepID=F0ZJG2_DICPU|nr:uncharacterized protein DICPUDRAFT_47417 [Dictyostelium purpureum]EGC35895.1 hypothetical protein DICPUDRAFT_47417 [Dictyostelium purpureum]|eukprot:XP_003287549.1 hypothetical protein DICPUDRAFT_47417 [Dictyostelium purpureum]